MEILGANIARTRTHIVKQTRSFESGAQNMYQLSQENSTYSRFLFVNFRLLTNMVENIVKSLYL